MQASTISSSQVYHQDKFKLEFMFATSYFVLKLLCEVEDTLEKNNANNSADSSILLAVLFVYDIISGIKDLLDLN